MLDKRLDALRRQAGGLPTSDEKSTSEHRELRHRMQRLRPRASNRPAGLQRPDDETIAQLVHGRVLQPGVVVTERVHREGAAHGRCRLSHEGQAFQSLAEAEGLQSHDLLFLDTETSGLAGGSGTSVFVLGLARFRDDAFTVRQYLLTAFAGEHPMLEDMARWVGEAGALVSYNGKSFDVPLLAARTRLVGLRDPLSQRRHVDLLHPTRRAFGSRWQDCRLARAERLLLGFERENDLSGAEAPQAWFDWLHRGEPGRLPDVLRHNQWDLVSLAALMPVLEEVHVCPDDYAADRLAIARHYRRAGAESSAMRVLEQSREQLAVFEQLELADLLRRRGDWPAACILWRGLAEYGCSEAAEHLAKYYEHVARDYARAMVYTQRLPEGAERQRRTERLLLKRKRALQSFSVLPRGCEPLPS